MDRVAMPVSPVNRSSMRQTRVSDALDAKAVGNKIKLCGWVRTRRDSKQGFSFLEVNNLQLEHGVS